MEFDKVYTVKKEISKDQFLRQLIIKLSNSPDTPIGITKADFGDVKESIKEVILCAAHVEMDYSASIGYDRQEKYWTKEKKHDSSTGRDYYVDVEKTRTVTDWQPHSGHISGDETCVAFNEEPRRAGYEEHEKIRKVILSINDEDIVEKGEAEVSYGGLETVKRTCEFMVGLGIRYPGDHHKDERTNGTVTVNELVCYKLPFYEVDYVYEGKTYHASGFACNESLMESELPPNNVDIKAIAANDTKKGKTIMIALWSAFAATFLLAFILCVTKIAFWLVAIPAVVFAAAIIFHVLYHKKFNARIRSLSEDNIKLKLQETKDCLKKRNYEDLSSDELALFDVNKRTISSEVRLGKSGGKGMVLPIVLGAIGLVILLIMSIVMGTAASNNKLHSPDQFTIEVTNKTQEFDENASGYLYGCYYIHLDYKITASNKIGATSMTIKTHVSDKSGNELGTITSSFDNMNLDAGNSKTYQTYLQENQIDRNALFKSVYNAKFSDLVFTFEITSVWFTDGGSYYVSNW